MRRRRWGGSTPSSSPAGIGEHAGGLRSLAAERLAWLGVRIDPGRTGEEITAPGAKVRTFVVAAREDLQAARETARLLGPLVPEPASDRP